MKVYNPCINGLEYREVDPVSRGHEAVAADQTAVSRTEAFACDVLEWAGITRSEDETENLTTVKLLDRRMMEADQIRDALARQVGQNAIEARQAAAYERVLLSA